MLSPYLPGLAHERFRMSSQLETKDEPGLAKLKQFALQTGLPFENDIEKVLKSVPRHGTWSLQRNYYFEATDSEETKYRSIDFICSIEYRARAFTRLPSNRDASARIHFLIEAKFTDSERWWLTPKPWSGTEQWSFPLLLPVHETEGGALFRQDGRKMAIPSRTLAVVQNGRKISFSSKSEPIDRESLMSYQVQLMQGAANFLVERSKNLGYESRPARQIHTSIEYLVPILVVNAPLTVVGDEVTTDVVKNGQSASEFSRELSTALLAPPMLRSLAKEIHALADRAYGETRPSLSWLKPETTYFPVLLSTVAGLPALLEAFIREFEAFAVQNDWLSEFPAPRSP